MRPVFLYLSLLLFLSSCGFTRNWSGSDIPRHNFATFSDLNGKQPFKMLAKDSRFVLHYKTVVTEGSLRMVLKSPTGVELYERDLQGTQADSLIASDQKPGMYTLIFKGRHASGSFDIRY